MDKSGDILTIILFIPLFVMASITILYIEIIKLFIPNFKNRINT